MSREDNIAVFQDTERVCKNHQTLSSAIKKSVMNQKLILETDQVETVFPDSQQSGNNNKEAAKVIVSKKRSYEAASAYREQKTCVHNFASASNPGGGVVKGSNAQEECLCRCSTLYFCLNTPQMWAGFYAPHRALQNPLHNDDCIYTPKVIVIKSDTASPRLLSESDWYSVNVITCAAPNLRLRPNNGMNHGDGERRVQIRNQELLRLHEKRLTRILDIAVAEENEVIILGAFGCGAFENNPEIVAQAARNVIPNYLHSFRTIEFAIYCSPRDEQNYKIFERVLKQE